VRRTVLGLSIVALALVACQDAQEPASNFQVADGSSFGGDGMTGGNPNFFFLPPLVPSPDYSGTFDATLLPYLRVQVSGYWDSDAEATCKADPDYDFGSQAGLAVDPVTESYSYGWNTPKSLKRDKVYRICVALALPGNTLILGYRDIMPTQGGGSVAEDPVYKFNLGSNLAIKFRVEEGVLNGALCVNGDDYDCTGALLTTAGESADCVGSTCSITAGGLTQPTLFLVERLPCDGTDPGIPEGHGPDQQGVNWIEGLDIPQYAGCVQVTVFDGSWNGFSTPGVIGACFYPESGPPLDDEQDESLRLHLQEHGTPGVVALDRVPSTDALEVGQCRDLYSMNAAPPAGASLASRLAWHVRQGWHTVQRTVNPWFAPPEALAFHTGFGGSTTLKSDGSTPTLSAAAPPTQGPTVQFHVTAAGAKVYMLAWALPSQMEKYQLGSTEGVVAAEPLTTNVGTPVTVKVMVTDDGETSDVDPASCVPDPLGGQICGYLLVPPREVKKALVHFATTNDATLSADSVLTTFDADPFGIAEVTVTPTKSGTSLVTASGLGIGARPATGFGGFVPPPDGQITLQTGSLSFEIYACDNAAAGFITPTIDGSLESTWQNADSSWTIPVNLGGGTSSTADVYVGHDCNNVYLALAVGTGAANNNSLRFVFDNNADGSEGVGDNIVSLTKNSAGAWIYQDRFLSADCIGSKQANCGPDDTSAGGSLNGAGSTGYNSATQKFVYEFRFPLKSPDAAHDFQRKLGDTIGFYLALSLGNGTKGNTEWPDQKGNFKSYENYFLTQH